MDVEGSDSATDKNPEQKPSAQHEMYPQMYAEAKKLDSSLQNRLLVDRTTHDNRTLTIFQGSFESGGTAGLHTEMGPVLIHSNLARELVEQPTYEDAMREVKARFGDLPWDVKSAQDEVNFPRWQEVVTSSAAFTENKIAQEAKQREFGTKAVKFLQTLNSRAEKPGDEEPGGPSEPTASRMNPPASALSDAYPTVSHQVDIKMPSGEPPKYFSDGIIDYGPIKDSELDRPLPKISDSDSSTPQPEEKPQE